MIAPDKAPFQALLFICSLNAVRSPMAEALARRRFGKKLFIDSAGLMKSERDPFALAALKEVGIDFEMDEPHTLDEIDCESFDLVIALSPEAHREAQALLRATSVELLYWPIDDATQVTGTREQRMMAYRQVRDGLDRLIRDVVTPRLPGVA
jgi:YD repeat-containing protein